MMWGWSFETWEWVVKTSLVLSVITGISTAFFAFVAGYVGYELADEVGKISDQKVADALAVAGKANENAGKANERAALADKAAEAEKLERLKLEEKLAPRFLTSLQKDEIKKSLEAYRGSRLDIIVYPTAPDVQSFANDLSEAIQSAGWDVKVWVAIGSGRVVRGLHVQTLLASGEDVDKVAKALVETLTNERIGAALAQQFPDGAIPDAISGPVWDVSNVSPIRMSVGAKP